MELLVLRKENSTLKEHNLRLGELILQRDTCIERQEKEIGRLSDMLKEREKVQVSASGRCDGQVEKEELQRLNRVMKEEALHHTTEMQQARALWLALQGELSRCRQEKETNEKEYLRVECALRRPSLSV